MSVLYANRRETHRDPRHRLSPPSRMAPMLSGVSTSTNESLGTTLSALLAQFPSGLSRRANIMDLPLEKVNINFTYHVLDARSKLHQMILINIAIKEVSMRRDIALPQHVISRTEYDAIRIEDGESWNSDHQRW